MKNLNHKNEIIKGKLNYVSKEYEEAHNTPPAFVLIKDSNLRKSDRIIEIPLLLLNEIEKQSTNIWKLKLVGGDHIYNNLPVIISGEVQVGYSGLIFSEIDSFTFTFNSQEETVTFDKN